MLRHAQEEAAKKRNIERQNKLNADSGRIVQLAQELSTACEPDGKGSRSSRFGQEGGRDREAGAKCERTNEIGIASAAVRRRLPLLRDLQR